MAPEDTEDETEPNLYRNTLSSAKSTAVDARDTITDTPGAIADPIANPLAQGGWVCDAADDWITELRSHLTGVDTAFGTAVTTLQTAYDGENERVPVGDPHGLAWTRTWHMIQYNLGY